MARSMIASRLSLPRAAGGQMLRRLHYTQALLGIETAIFMTGHIGIVACSAEGAALCYRTICVEGAALLGAHAHPEVSMHTHPLCDYMRCIYRDDWQAVCELML